MQCTTTDTDEDSSEMKISSREVQSAMPKTAPEQSAVQDRPASKNTCAKARPNPASVFHKTSICKFHAKGLCNRGETCKFAHNFGDLRALPDLSCTKICPFLLRTGLCQDLGCRYAHTQDELKEYEQVCKSEANPMSMCTAGAQGSASPKMLSQLQLLDQLVDEGIINVKNTFINVEPQPPQLRHVASAPALSFGH